MNVIRRIGAYILLVGVYGFTWLVAVVGGAIPRRAWKPTGRIMVTGTFFNPNWYLSHITPLTRSGVKEVILVIDEPQLPLDGVTFVCPPKWLAKLISRAGAKAIWVFYAGIRYWPDLYMGYHIIPGACSALIAGRLLGRPSCYQVTGAPLGFIRRFPEAVGSDEGLASRSKLIEAMALRVVKQFDYIVVRGNKAKEYLVSNGVECPIDIITGSVNGHRQSPRNGRDIHLIYVGQLSRIKQVDQFIAIVESVARVIPSVRAAIVGDGPLMTELRTAVRQLGLARNIEFFGKRVDVEAFLVRACIFVLTSKSEGLSIAMAEAMTAGVVPVVADVGELGDLVTNGVNGYLVEPNNIAEYSMRIVSLLQNPAMWAQCSRRAIENARSYSDIEVITEKWRRVLRHCAGPEFDLKQGAVQ